MLSIDSVFLHGGNHAACSDQTWHFTRGRRRDHVHEGRKLLKCYPIVTQSRQTDQKSKSLNLNSEVKLAVLSEHAIRAGVKGRSADCFLCPAGASLQAEHLLQPAVCLVARRLLVRHAHFHAAPLPGNQAEEAHPVRRTEARRAAGPQGPPRPDAVLSRGAAHRQPRAPGRRSQPIAHKEDASTLQVGRHGQHQPEQQPEEDGEQSEGGNQPRRGNSPPLEGAVNPPREFSQNTLAADHSPQLVVLYLSTGFYRVFDQVLK